MILLSPQVQEKRIKFKSKILCVRVTESLWTSASLVENGYKNDLLIGSGDKTRCNRLMEMLSKVDYHANITNDKQCSVCGCELVRECVCVCVKEKDRINIQQTRTLALSFYL